MLRDALLVLASKELKVCQPCGLELTHAMHIVCCVAELMRDALLVLASKELKVCHPVAFINQCVMT